MSTLSIIATFKTLPGLVAGGLPHAALCGGEGVPPPVLDGGHIVAQPRRRLLRAVGALRPAAVRLPTQQARKWIGTLCAIWLQAWWRHAYLPVSGACLLFGPTIAAQVLMLTCSAPYWGPRATIAVECDCCAGKPLYAFGIELMPA